MEEIHYTTTNIKDTVKLRCTDDDPMEPTTIIRTLMHTVTYYGNRDALYYQKGTNWLKLAWIDYYDLAKRVASGFISLGLQNGEGVSILGFNSPEWVIANMAAIMAGGISVGLYPTNSSETCDFIINDSKSTIIVVENDQCMQKILQIPENNRAGIKAIIQCDNQVTVKANNIYNWSDFLVKAGTTYRNDYVTPIMKKLKPNQCCTLIYTSGTTGNPKGVMLSHDNIIWTIKTILDTVKIYPTDPLRIVSYLPLSHIAGQMFDIYMPLINGGQTWFAKPTALKGTLIETLKDVQPTIFLGVPRVWEKIMKEMKKTGTNMGTFKQYIATKSKEIGLKQYYETEKGSKKTSFLWDMCNKFVYTEVREKLGLSKCNLLVTGAAPIAKETLEYFASLNMPINDIYGMSESSGPISFSYTDAMKIGSSGKIIKNADFKINPITQEICIRGRNVMMGYLNQPDKTKEAIDENGWLHSGDMGKLDNNGYLHIIGRIKELIITAGGENIPPIIIEDNVKSELQILSNCMLIGDKQKYLTILLTLKCKFDSNNVPTNDLDPVAISILCSIGSYSTTVTEALADKILNNHLQEGIDRANKKSISKAQYIQKFKILPVDFSLHGDELGPTLKLKRNVVLKKYSSIIDEFYTSSSNDV